MAELLRDLGYSLQANRKVLEGSHHPDRKAQFAHLNAAVQLQLSLGEPVISVDTKKKMTCEGTPSAQRKLLRKTGARGGPVGDRRRA